MSSTKIYRDLREVYWWEGMKMEMLNFLASAQIASK